MKFSWFRSVKLREFTLLVALYLAQGLPYGFFTQALPVLLRKSEISLSMIGFTHLLTLPWALKFVWAPAVDRIHSPRLGRRRSWLLPLQATSVALYLTLAFVSLESDLFFVLLAFLLSNLLAASQDVATDGLAVDLLSYEDRGWANGIQVAAYRLGMIVGGGALLVVYDKLNWSGVMFSMAAIAALCTWPVIAFREVAVRVESKLPPLTSVKVAWREVWHFFSLSGALRWSIILLIYKSGHASATAMLRPWLVDHGYSMADIAWILGSAGFAAGLLGAMAGAFAATRFNRRSLLVRLGVLQCLSVSVYLWPALTTSASYKIAIAASLDHFTSGMATTVLFTLMMDACSKERAASDYTAQACLIVIAQGLAAALAGISAQRFGYDVHFAISAAFAAGAIGLTAWQLKQPSLKLLFSTPPQSSTLR